MTSPYGRTPSRTKGACSLGRMATLLGCIVLSCPGPPASAEEPTRQVRILALGDSLTAGYGLAHAQGFVARLQASLDAAGARATVLDGGVSGDTSAGGLARLDWALGDKPDAVIVELGANDGLRGLDPGQMEHNLAAILDRLASLHLPVLFTGMLAPPNEGAAYGAAFKAVFKRLGQRPGLINDPFFLAGVAGNRTLDQADGMHPSPEGVDIIVRRMTPLVLQLIAEVRAGPGAGGAAPG